jgi:hypothetical protein
MDEMDTVARIDMAKQRTVRGMQTERSEAFYEVDQATGKHAKR